MAVFKVVLTAGGTSRRFGGTNKLFENLNGKPVICHSADIFTEMGLEIVIPAHRDAIDDMKKLFDGYQNIRIITGGITRQQSVYRGLQELYPCDYAIIHDAARPLVSKDIIQRGMDAVLEKKAVITAVKTTDTIKKVDINKKIVATPDRISLINVQTPQIFDYQMILACHAKHQDKSMTDDACLCEASDIDVYYTDGDYSNIKITNKIDILYAELLIKNQNLGD